MLDNAMKPMIEYVYSSIKSFRAWAFTEENEINPQLKATADIIGQILLKAFEALKNAKVQPNNETVWLLVKR